MKPIEYQVMASLEDEHWWYRGLRKLVVKGLTRSGGKDRVTRIIDGGCGTGGCYRAIRSAFRSISYAGIDTEPMALDYCRRSGLSTVVKASINQMPFRPGSADVVICLDVLSYSGVCPRTAIQQFREVLKPKGLLVLNLPAFDALRGRHDLAVGIHRRFRRGEVRALMEQAGFEPIRITYWNMLLFLPMMAWRWISRWNDGTEPRSDLVRLPKWLNRVLEAVLSVEVVAARSISLPFGSSVFLLAQKPG